MSETGRNILLALPQRRGGQARHTCDLQLSFLATPADRATARKETAFGTRGQAPAFTPTNLAWTHCWVSSHESPFSYYGDRPSEEASHGFVCYLEAGLEITVLRKRTRLGWKWEASQHIYFGFLFRGLQWKPTWHTQPFLWPPFIWLEPNGMKGKAWRFRK